VTNPRLPWSCPSPPRSHPRPTRRALLAAFAARDIEWHCDRVVRALDPARKTAVFADNSEMPYDLFLGVPVHRAPAVVVESGLTVDGWIPVNPQTLETKFPGVYAVGDVTSVGTPKAGVFAEGQAAVVADTIAAQMRGTAGPGPYDGRALCYLEFGHDEVGAVDVTFVSGQPPIGVLEGPSQALAEEKLAFGANRIRRWFGRSWPTAGRSIPE